MTIALIGMSAVHAAFRAVQTYYEPNQGRTLQLVLSILLVSVLAVGALDQPT